MKVNRKDFFREATLRICGSLNTETFLGESFKYIRTFVPAEQAFLTHISREKREHVVLAQASPEGASMLGLSIPISPDLQAFAGRLDDQPLVVDKAEKHPTARPWISKGILNKNASLLVLRLVIEGEVVGAVVFTASNSGRFTDDHAHLLSLLREPFAIALSNSLRYAEVIKLKELLLEDNRFLRNELKQAAGEEIIGAEFGLQGVMELVRQVSPLSSPVLLLGETGTGKEVIARAIHKLSSRKDGPFITVNCGAIPESLMDSELFGHEKGAFTGAIAQKRGRFERAHGGTIFLDEVGELQPEVQVRLLRVLQEKEIERIGGSEFIKLDIRVIAASNRPLEKMVRNGDFREDLFFRLKVFPINIPPLRERQGDIPSLVYYFIRKKSNELGIKGLSSLAPGALERLTTYAWPGNVRELGNAVERALIISKGGLLRFDDFGGPIGQENHSQIIGLNSQTESVYREGLSLNEVLIHNIRQAIEKTHGKIGGRGGAAELLKINPSTLRKKMRKLGIPFGRGRQVNV